MNTEIPRTIGRYRIVRQIGLGAMGEVYLAHDELIHRKVAIKCMRVDRCINEQKRQKAIESFLHEARIVGNLDHSHIAAVYDIGVRGNAPYIVMEYVEGDNIKELIENKAPFSIEEKLSLIAMMARALHFAHKRGILHRDIKPANIMILQQSRLPKITDFGIARVLDVASFGSIESSIDEEGFIPGTPLYMSPEQIRGEELDRRSDIFSLGILAYEWLSGKKPFEGKDLDARLQSVLTNNPKPLSDFPGIDPEIDRIIMQALAKPRDERYQSADAFGDALELYLNSLEKKKDGGKTGFSFDKKEIVERLRQRYLFFADFSEEELYELFRASRKEEFGMGDYLIQEGTSGTKMYIIISGAVIVLTETEGKRVELETLRDGSCVGEMSMIDHLPRSASVVAFKKTVALVVNETVLRHNNPKLCLKLYRNLATTLSERLRASEAKYLKLLATHLAWGEKNGVESSGFEAGADS
ncbi:serine/threonine-protein kinase [Thiovibrio frasassiensis]|uniref:Serine/threonine-protein kinase n=1 Tax=Thiovibrio frasassiensis TaxID=2984131 RepID=A0A9X4RLE5_9BACT|nr:serine/threonine-protein kinase [Thiovibrio frasassiensis]MDG4475043.1 serine/threonine-protein kinase [Thiovibrio frasassiensis]